jgi:hypothetical protein
MSRVQYPISSSKLTNVKVPGAIARPTFSHNSDEFLIVKGKPDNIFNVFH